MLVLLPIGGIFLGREIGEFEASIVPGDHGDEVLRILDVAQRNARTRKRRTFASAGDGAGNAETSRAGSGH